MALTVGSRLGHYDVTALIGEGGMGQVYQATDTKLNRQVALKILNLEGYPFARLTVRHAVSFKDKWADVLPTIATMTGEEISWNS